MIKLNKNELGFGAIEALLITIIVVAIGGVGWYVWHAKKSTIATYNSVGNNSNSPAIPTKKSAAKKTPPPSPYLGWKVISTGDKVMATKIPASWTDLNCPSNTTGVYAAPDITTLAKCASDNVGEVGMSYADQDLSNGLQKAKGVCDSSFSTTQTTVNALPATRVERIEASPSDNCIFNTQGAKDVNYSIFNGGKSYFLNYRQLAAGTDDLPTFELIVQATTF